MLIALNIEVPDRRGSADGAAVCLDILRRNRVQASFVAAPALFPAISAAQADGHEIGLLTDLRHAWRRASAKVDHALVEQRLHAACKAYRERFGCEPLLHASAAWQSNPHVLRLTQRLGFARSSDARGTHPFVPVWNGEIVRCIQCPSTLPAIEALGRPETDAHSILSRLLELTAIPAPAGHLLTLGADRLDRKGWELFEELLMGWREQGHEVVSVQILAAKLDLDKLPRHELALERLPGERDATLEQGEEFLSDWRQAA